ncbi:MAG: L-threonylcarbamoyladenylate synthase [Alphaproteobacteria bacterium]|nr:L-threonylcarbamoyladenylate synthase [Alphaproteobacteria bacterium]
MPTVVPVDDASIARAAALLREGKLVAFPTETVYGLGGDATNGQAVAAIYAAKGRPNFNPLIIHVADAVALDNLIEWNDIARLLAASFWPGPLTLILPRRKDAAISLLASAGLDTLAVRIPSHPAAQKLLRAVGLPIAAPSANASGKLSPTTPLHVAESLGDKADLILAGGRSQIGIESTVVNLAAGAPMILRPGGITREQLEMVLGQKIAVFEATATPDAPASPGMLASHYAPNIPVRLNAESAEPNEAWLAFGADKQIRPCAARLNLSPQGDLNEAAANLFAMLRELDKPAHAAIAVAPIPAIGLGVAINDRLQRAAVR